MNVALRAYDRVVSFFYLLFHGWKNRHDLMMNGEISNIKHLFKTCIRLSKYRLI